MLGGAASQERELEFLTTLGMEISKHVWQSDKLLPKWLYSNFVLTMFDILQ